MNRRTILLIHTGIWLIFLLLPLLLIIMIPYEIPRSVKFFSIMTSTYTFGVFYAGYHLLSRILLNPGGRVRKGLKMALIIGLIFGIKLLAGLTLNSFLNGELSNYGHFKWWTITGDFVNQ